MPPPHATTGQADLQAAELAKRSIEGERQELAALRDSLRQQQASAAAEAARLAELQQREAALNAREEDVKQQQQRLATAQAQLGDAERRVRAGADSVAEGLVAQARSEADAILQTARDECRHAEAELKALREQLAEGQAALWRREVAAAAAEERAREAAETAQQQQRRASVTSGLLAEKEQMLRSR